MVTDKQLEQDLEQQSIDKQYELNQEQQAEHMELQQQEQQEQQDEVYQEQQQDVNNDEQQRKYKTTVIDDETVEVTRLYFMSLSTIDTLGYKSPASLTEAMNTPHAQQWFEAGVNEMNGLQDNNTWAWIPESEVKDKYINSKMIFEHKIDGRFKARLVVIGYSH